jgi:CheY-like chemotaxis protein
MSEPIRVLVVDDDPDELELLTASLAPLGVMTARAASGEEAVKLVEGGRFSAAVLDLLMPRLNGFQTAALMRRTENGRGMPILILSGYDETASRRIEGWDEVSGRVQYLEKPFSAEALRERVAAAYSPAWKSSEGLAPSL